MVFVFVKGDIILKDENIVNLLKKKDEKGIFALSEKYEKLLYYIASTILGNRVLDIEECVNDTYYKIWSNIDKYDLKKSSLKTYLKIIVRNTAINRIRDITRTGNYIYEDGFSNILENYADSKNDPEKRVIDKEKIELLEDIILNLNKKDKELIVRRYFYIQNSKDIAELMGMSVSAVDSRLSRLRTKIKGEFSRGG